jgi:hypothetical protein
MIPPPVWTEAELVVGQLAAVEGFRRERIDEPLARYLEVYDKHRDLFVAIVEAIAKAAPDSDLLRAELRDLLKTEAHLEALRYLVAPPISEDDLKVVAGIPSLSPRVLGRNPEAQTRIVLLLERALDPRRFSWLGRDTPSAADQHAAVVASTTLLASRRRVSNTCRDLPTTPAARGDRGVAQHVPGRRCVAWRGVRSHWCA